MREHHTSTTRIGRRAPPPGSLLPWGIMPTVVAALMIVCLSLSPLARADLFEAFEAPQTSWKLSEADCAVGLLEHHRTFQEKYQGQGSEYIHLRAGAGTHVYLTHATPEARIIEELTPSLWVKSDRPGVRLLVRVVLPRTPVGSEGEVLKTLLRGDSYTDIGNWQRLSLNNLPLLMSRELALLRTQFGPQVDAREAYIDLVVVNAYGGAGNTRVWLDSLSVTGIAQAEVGAEATGTAASANRNSLPQVPSGQEAAPQGSFAAAKLPTQGPEPKSGSPRMEFQGNVLTVDGRPRFVRAIEHSGESLEFLQGLGFNAVRLSGPATPAQLRKARQLGLWLIAPPPQTVSERAQVQAHDSVLVWDAGEGLSQRDLEATRQLISRTRIEDPLRRPVLTIPRDSLSQYSRMSDIVALRSSSQPSVASDMPLGDYRTWIGQQRRLLRPAMASWAVLPTQLRRSIVEQWRAIDPQLQPADAVEPQQLHLLAYQALSAGARGLLFTSRTRLDQADASSALRATTLQCLNQQLHLLEPWVAGGELSRDYEVNDPALSVALLKTDRSVLALLTKSKPPAQYVSGPMTPRPVNLVLRGVPASAHAFGLSPIGLNKLRASRQGGMRVQLEQFRHSSVVLVSQDPLVINHAAQEIRKMRRPAARARRELVARQLALTKETLQHSNTAAAESGLRASNLEQAEAYLRRSELLLDAGDDRSSVGAAAESLEFLSAVRRDAWQGAVKGFPAPNSSPACASFASLPLHWQLTERLRESAWGGNQLPGGDMENLQFMQSVGWDQQRNATHDISTLVELTPQAPRSGDFALRIAAAPTNPDTSPLILDQAPLQVQSAPVQLWPGQLVQIRGWAKVRPGGSAEASLAHRTPLLVYDSFGGEALAQQVTADNTWREFVLYRIAPDDAPITLTLSLRSYGEALIDDVTIMPLQMDAPAPASSSPSASDGR